MELEQLMSWSPGVVWTLLSAVGAFVIGCAAHAFGSARPQLRETEEAPRARRLRLGEILVARDALSSSDLDEALQLAQDTALPLGQVLTNAALVGPVAVAGAVGNERKLPVLDPDPSRTPLSLLQRLPEDEAEAAGALPIDVMRSGRVLIAFAAPPSIEVLATLEARLGAGVQVALASPDAILHTRRRAYRRLRPDAAPAFRPRLGEALVQSGHVPATALPAALAEQRETGERLGEVLVRKALASPDGVARALGSPNGFRTVRPEDVDIESLRRLDYGFCALYGVVPLRRTREGAPLPLASAQVLHKSVLERASTRCSGAVEAVLAPAVDVRVALAVASANAWPTGVAGLGPSLDWAELRALSEEPAVAAQLPALAVDARDRGRAPLDHLEDTGRISPTAAARVRARSLGIAVVSPAAVRPARDVPGLLPPSLVAAHDLHVHQTGPQQIVLAAPRPTPQLAQEVAALFPSCAVVWEVLVPMPALRRHTDSDSLTG